MTDTPPVETSSDPVVPPPDSGRPLADLLNDLTGPTVAIRLAAAQQLGRLTAADLPTLRALEKVAAQDSSAEVREAALLALAAPAYRLLQQRDSRLSSPLRQTILTEINRWAADGLLPAQTANLLRQRYNFDQRPGPVATAAPAVPAGPKPTLTQVLLSETTITVALYLGAFFVVVAAFIMAAIIDVLRLPILGITTLGFLGAALGLKWRLPTASFVLFAVFSFLIPIDAAVLLDLFRWSNMVTWPFWVIISGLLSLVWMGGTFFYRSRFFSLLSLLAASLAMLFIARWLDFSLHLDVLLVELVTLASLGGTLVLERWQDRRFALPFFLLAQLQQLLVLSASALVMLVLLLDRDLPGAGEWAVIAFTWLLAAIFYALSHLLTNFPLFPPLAVAVALPVPLFLSGVFSPTTQAVMALAWAWGTGLALGGEGLGRVKWPRLAVYGFYMLLASAGLYLLAATGGLIDRVAFGLAYLLGTTIVYLALTLYRPRIWLWSGALIAGTADYLALFFLPSVESWEFYPGFILLWPALALLALSLALRRGGQANRLWHLPPLILGALIGAAAGTALLITGLTDEPGRAALAWLIVAAFLALFGLVDRRPWLGYGVTVSLALAVVFGLIWQEWQQWVLPLVGLAALYFISGLALTLMGQDGGWARVLRWSGLALGTLVSLSAPVQGEASAVIGPALVATFFALEAFRTRNIWLGFPAAGLYIVAYFTLLVQLEVSQPQFYSIGAALLGFIMHYLLNRSGNYWAAFITGLVSQLALLGTTYIQMFSTHQLLYFFVLFGQALVVLVYGLVVRSRSLVLAPLVFVILGAITVALSALAGLPALILIGCTGFLLLLLGIVALVMRERLLAATSQLGQRLGKWQA